jgi:hypothetical protein
LSDFLEKLKSIFRLCPKRPDLNFSGREGTRGAPSSPAPEYTYYVLCEALYEAQGKIGFIF